MVLEMTFMGGVVLTILCGLGGGYFSVMWLIKNQALKKEMKKKIKNKKKKKRTRQRIKRLKNEKKKLVIFSLICFGLTVSFGSGAAYLSYYQSMNLANNDSEDLVTAHFLLADFKKQLHSAKENKEEENKQQQNLRILATRMASFGTKRASTVNTEEGQLVLNRYYNSIKQLGMNGSMQINNFYNNVTLVEEFLTDIVKIEEEETVVFKYYKVDEAMLKEK